MTNTVPTNSHPMRFIVINHYQVYEMKWYMCIIDYTWLVVSNIFSIYGMTSFPLTNSIIFQDGEIAPPTRSPCLMGKLTISTGPFSIVFCMFTRGYRYYQVLMKSPKSHFSPPRCCCNAGYTWSKEQRKCQSDTPEEEEKCGRGNCCAKLGKRWGKSAFFFWVSHVLMKACTHISVERGKYEV